MNFKIGDRVVTRNNKYWSNKLGTVESAVEHEFETIYMVRLDEASLKMCFKTTELRKV